MRAARSKPKMKHDPNRASGAEPSTLARLVAQGEARLRAVHRPADERAQTAAADRNLRIAIGAIRGAPIRRALLALILLCVVGLVAGGLTTDVLVAERFGHLVLTPLGTTGAILPVWLVLLYAWVPPIASRAAVRDERAWIASLPFKLEHYVDVLSEVPEVSCRLRVELHWQGPGLSAHTLQCAVALFDARARVIEAREGFASFTSSPISGRFGPRTRRSYFALRNHRLALAVHQLVELALVPIHRHAPLVRVRLSRDY